LSGVNTYDGPVTVDQGALVAANSQALGSTAGGTFVNSGAALRVEGGVSIAENFVIRDVGVGLNLSSMGAVRSTGGNNTISGTITLGSSSGFGVDNGSTLTLSGPIMMAPSSDLAATDAGFTKFGAGTLVVGGPGDNVVTGQVTVLEGTLQLNKT